MKNICRMSKNIARLQKARNKEEEITPIESFEEFIKDIKNEPIDEQYEIVSIVGDCI
jgi:hypothetical protein